MRKVLINTNIMFVVICIIIDPKKKKKHYKKQGRKVLINIYIMFVGAPSYCGKSNLPCQFDSLQTSTTPKGFVSFLILLYIVQIQTMLHKKVFSKTCYVYYDTTITTNLSLQILRCYLCYEMNLTKSIFVQFAAVELPPAIAVVQRW